MATQSPFSWLESLLQSTASGFRPPAWAVDEAQRRIVLLINHVLMQEPAATSRLVRQKGKVVLVQWRSFGVRFLVTPAGLLDLALTDASADLSLTVTDGSPAVIAQTLLRGDKPGTRIEGDVQLAADVNWLADHVRWDLEEDLSRIVGDVPAHTLGQFARRLTQGLRQFVGASPDVNPADAATP